MCDRHDDPYDITGNAVECSGCRKIRQRSPRFRTTQNLARRERRNQADEARIRRMVDEWL